MREKINAIKVNQWLPEWDEVCFDNENFRRKPHPEFYIFSISAKKLKALSDIRRRKENLENGMIDTGIQRQHDSARSNEISRFIHVGYPCSDMNARQLAEDNSKSLRKPGWLPTSIVVNIIGSKDKRNGKKVSEKDLITVDTSNDQVFLNLPENFSDSWTPTSLAPLEVIDGQHRLWAFDENFEDDFELPVVAFWELDISWQAYLFWSINIKPKKINPSLAFDLYPLLRAQDWLENFQGPVVYREARAQELVNMLWSNQCSPWNDRINMLGDRGLSGQVSQAAWIRSLMATYIKAWNSPEKSLGGFFGAAQKGDSSSVIPWSRAQQAAFIMFIGNSLRSAIKNNTTAHWIRKINDGKLGFDVPGFESSESLLTTDQGIRGLLDLTNMILCACYTEINQDCLCWRDLSLPDENVTDASEQLKSLENSDYTFTNIIKEMSKALSFYDWRSYNAQCFAASEQDSKDHKAAFRGSGGYKMIRKDLIEFLESFCKESLILSAVKRIKNIIEL